MWDRFFFYLNRLNAVAFALLLLATIVFLAVQASRMPDEDYYLSDETASDFGSSMERLNSIIGQGVETKGADIVAYYESDAQYERKELAGLILVNPETTETLQVADAGSELLVSFEFLFDQGIEDQPVVGYIARVATETGYEQGRSNLIIGALPAMTKTVVAENVVFVDLSTVRSDGTVAVIMWQEQDVGEVVAFNLTDGKVVDRARIEVPVTDPERLSQGPGKSFDASLLRRRGDTDAPVHDFAF